MDILEELFDSLPAQFKYKEHPDCYWELYKAECSGIRYYIRVCSEYPYKEIKRFDSKKLLSVLKEAAEWIKVRCSTSDV